MAINSPETPLKGAALDAYLSGVDEDDPQLIWTLMERTQKEVGQTALVSSVTPPSEQGSDPESSDDIPAHGETAKANFLSVPEEEPPVHEVIKTDYIRAHSAANSGRFQRLRKVTRRFLQPLGMAREAIDAAELIVSEFSGNFIRHVLGYEDEWDSTPHEKDDSTPSMPHDKFGRLDICKVKETGELLIICHAVTQLSADERAREQELAKLDKENTLETDDPFLDPTKNEHGLGITLIRELSRRDHGIGRYHEEGAPEGVYSMWAVVDGSNMTLAA